MMKQLLENDEVSPIKIDNSSRLPSQSRPSSKKTVSNGKLQSPSVKEAPSSRPSSRHPPISPQRGSGRPTSRPNSTRSEISRRDDRPISRPPSHGGGINSSQYRDLENPRLSSRPTSHQSSAANSSRPSSKTRSKWDTSEENKQLSIRSLRQEINQNPPDDIENDSTGYQDYDDGQPDSDHYQGADQYEEYYQGYHYPSDENGEQYYDEEGNLIDPSASAYHEGDDNEGLYEHYAESSSYYRDLAL
jgi:hypothetical protein